MELHPYVDQVQTQLAAAAALGDDRTRHTAQALSAAVAPAIRLAVLSAVSSVADDITAALLDFAGSPVVVVRLDGDELRVEVRSAEPDVAPTALVEDDDASARISLRIGETLKAGVESAARAESVSVNTWLVRAAATALAGTGPDRRGAAPGGRRRPGSTAHRVTGWING